MFISLDCCNLPHWPRAITDFYGKKFGGRVTLLDRRQFIQGIGAAAAAAIPRGIPAQTPRPEIRVLPIEFGSEKMVFCDWWFLDAGYGLPFTVSLQRETHDASTFMPRGIRLRTAAPMLSKEPILIADTPTDGTFLGGYSTLLKDGGKYRLWYESYQGGASDYDVKTCYAESDDGFTWKKPHLGIFEYQGSKNNNVVYVHGHGATIFIDPTANAAERYKMVFLSQVPMEIVNGKQLDAFVFGAVSPDGLHWRRLAEPLIKQTSDTQSVAEYDPVRGKYVAYLRSWDPQTRGGAGGRRIVVRTESTEFGSFGAPTPVLTLGPEDPPDADIYTNAYRRWPEASRAHLMIPAIYHRSSDFVDLRLAVSRDGVRWQFAPGDPFMAVGEPGSGYEGSIYAGCGTVTVGKGMWAFPVARCHNTHNMYPRQGNLWLALLREDSFVGLEAESEGECWTQPATFEGSRLLINSWGMTGARVTIEITGEIGKPFPGYSLVDCDGLSGEQLWSPMTWRGNSGVGALQGKLVRLHFKLNRVRLYAFRFA